MPPEVLEKVIDIIQTPPDENRYTYLKTVLLERLSASEEKRIAKLLYNTEMGDNSPSEFHRRLTQLAGTSTDISARLVRRLWLSRLPKAIEIAVISHSDRELSELLSLADKIWEATKGPSVSVCESTQEQNELKAMRGEIQELRSMLSRIQVSDRRGRSRSRKFSRSPPSSRSGQRSKSNRGRSEVCWFHTKYGASAIKCTKPCSFVVGNDQKNE